MSFSYDPEEPTPLDVIRGLAVDTTDPGIVADETYVAVMASYGATAVKTAPFYRAAADLLRRVANAIDQDPDSIASTGDGSIGWSATRTKGLRDDAARYDAMADALDASTAGHWGSRVTVKSDFLTGGSAGTW